MVEGTARTVAHSFSESRAVVDYDGLYVLVDLNTDGTWSLSGEPAREDEKDILKNLITPMKRQVEVIIVKDD